MPQSDYPQRFSDALVSEIKAEMGRQSLSSRALGRLIGKSSQYMSDRLDGGSPKTGKRVQLNALDMSAIATALGLTEFDLVIRAREAAEMRGATIHDLTSRRVARDADTDAMALDEEAVAKKNAIDPYETDDDV